MTCKVENEIYKEGELFYAPNTCAECVCNKGFKNEYYVEPFCKRMQCVTQLDSAEMLARRCAPLYLVRSNGLLCCPVDFICRKFLQLQTIA